MNYMDSVNNLKARIKNARKLAGITLETKDDGSVGMEKFHDTIRNLQSLVTEQADVAVKNAEAIGELKDTNDSRLKELEKRGSGDVLDDEKLKRINDDLKGINELKTGFSGIKDDLEKLQIKMNRPDIGNGDSGDTLLQRQYKTAFDQYARRESDGAIRALDTKDSPMLIGSPTDGGYAVPEHLDRNIMSMLKADNVMRRLARVMSVGTSDYKRLVNKGGTTHGWVDESDPREQTDPSKLAQIDFPVHGLYSYPGVSQEALDDIFFDVEKFIEDEVFADFAEEEETAFIVGNGVKKPKGLLVPPGFSAEPDKTRAFGIVERQATGAATGITADVIMKLPYRLKARHRKRSSWLMNSMTIGEVRLLKNDAGDYLWREGLELDRPNLLNGRPVEAAEGMPDIGANAMPVSIGNWKRAYMIIDRNGIFFLRNPYNVIGRVYFYFVKRLGGNVVDTEAYKVLQCAE